MLPELSAPKLSATNGNSCNEYAPEVLRLANETGIDPAQAEQVINAGLTPLLEGPPTPDEAAEIERICRGNRC